MNTEPVNPMNGYRTFRAKTISYQVITSKIDFFFPTGRFVQDASSIFKNYRIMIKLIQDKIFLLTFFISQWQTAFRTHNSNTELKKKTKKKKNFQLYFPGHFVPIEAHSTMWALAARAMYWYQVLHIVCTNATSAHIFQRASGHLVPLF